MIGEPKKTIIAILVSLNALACCRDVPGQQNEFCAFPMPGEVFCDDVSDGDAEDGDPVTWSIVPGYRHSRFEVISGDLHVWPNISDKPALIGVMGESLGDTSIRAQVRLEATSDEAAAVYARGDIFASKAHGLEVGADGSLWLGIGNNFEAIETDLDPTNEDVILQLDVIGEEITAWAWPASEPMPDEPQFMRTTGELPVGIPGVYYAPSVEPQGAAGTAIFRYVRVATAPIPAWADVQRGDFNRDGELNAEDIDILSSQIRTGSEDLEFDLNLDDSINRLDHTFWVKDLRQTWFGDANLDNEFNSSDLVDVFKAGKYERAAQDAGWGEGDWNSDGYFDSADLVDAFADGGYEQGPFKGAAGVPEPQSLLMLMVGLTGLAVRRRKASRSSGTVCSL